MGTSEVLSVRGLGNQATTVDGDGCLDAKCSRRAVDNVVILPGIGCKGGGGGGGGDGDGVEPEDGERTPAPAPVAGSPACW